MSIEENKAIARRWSEEIWGKTNLAVADELLSTDFVFNYPNPGVAANLEGYKQTLTMNNAAVSDLRCTVDDMVAEGDKVAVRWTWAGTHKGELMGIPPTGKQVMITGISILHIVGGRIVEDWGEMDNLGLMQQLGAKIG